MKNKLATLVLTVLLVTLLVQSGFASSMRSGSSNPVPAPEEVNPSDIAPANYSRLSTRYQGKCQCYCRRIWHNRTAYISAGGPSDSAALWNADWNTASTTMFSKFAGGGGATTVQFKPSSPWAHGYNNDPDAGWNSNDLSLSTTTMTVTVRYTNAAYFQGGLLDAIATFKSNTHEEQDAWASMGSPTLWQCPVLPDDSVQRQPVSWVVLAKRKGISCKHQLLREVRRKNQLYKRFIRRHRSDLLHGQLPEPGV